MPVDIAAAFTVITECRAGLAVEPADGGLWESCTELYLRICRHLFPSGRETADSSRIRADALDMYRRALMLNERESRRFVTAMAELVPDGRFLVQGLEGAATPAARVTVGLLIERGWWSSVSAEYWNVAKDSANRRGLYLAAAQNLKSRKMHREAFTALKGYRYVEEADAPLAYLAALSAEALGPESEEWSAAEDYYRTALELDDERADYRRRMGMHLVRKGSYDAAEPLLLEAARTEPGDHRFRYYLGLIADARGEEERALDYYREAFKLQPDNRHYRRLVEKRAR
jgi:tetratricopeptide (TPR) repeat protein